jgi:hypothetical protein
MKTQERGKQMHISFEVFDDLGVSLGFVVASDNIQAHQIARTIWNADRYPKIFVVEQSK